MRGYQRRRRYLDRERGCRGEQLLACCAAGLGVCALVSVYPVSHGSSGSGTTIQYAGMPNSA